MFIVELEIGVWITTWDGDPGRTLIREDAKKFKTKSSALRALSWASEFRKFLNAKVVQA